MEEIESTESTETEEPDYSQLEENINEINASLLNLKMSFKALYNEVRHYPTSGHPRHLPNIVQLADSDLKKVDEQVSFLQDKIKKRQIEKV